MRWLVGNGKRIRFWEDNWIGGKPLIYNKFSGLQEPLKRRVGLKVEDFIDERRKWKHLSTLDIPNREDPLIKELKDMISYHTLPLHTQLDEVVWDRWTNGRFLVNFVYQLIFEKDQTSISWSKIWNS